MPLTAMEREFVEKTAELAAEKASSKAVDKMAQLMDHRFKEHRDNCGARKVWQRVAPKLVLAAFAGGGITGGAVMLIEHFTKGH